ncbi:MAG: hypothetical protein QG673_1972, partial [Pseudomonadota bacterium]|nr:hypothetical protein [Pseudomonadota bacterium]
MKLFRNLSILGAVFMLLVLAGCSSGSSSSTSSPTPHSYLSQPTGTYTNTCQNVVWDPNSSMLAGLCQSESGSAVTASLYYNACVSGSGVSNNNGQLVCDSYPNQPLGSYSQTCSNIEWNGVVLSANCASSHAKGAPKPYSSLYYGYCQESSQVQN